jgi:hypothetical protein
VLLCLLQRRQLVLLLFLLLLHCHQLLLLLLASAAVWSSSSTTAAPASFAASSAASSAVSSAVSSAAVALSSVEDKLNSYISKCISEGQKHDFDLQTQVYEVLASKKIILLRKGQQCKKLIEQVDVDSLLKNTRSDALNTKIEVDINIYLKLATLLRGLNETIDRRAMKIQLDQLYAEANEEDGVIIKIFSNLAQKLPNQERLSHVGEMELIVNFLDPILSPICHCPDKNKLLVWLNRQDENTSVLQPDAIMMATPQKTSDITLGYVEVKPNDSMSNPELAFVDLVRLGAFGRSLMLRKSNRKAIAVQCIGYTIVFYLLLEQNGITIMADILKINISKNITEIGDLLQKVDDLKRIISLYECQMESKYKNARPLEDELNSMMENVNPKRRKQRVAFFSLE